MKGPPIVISGGGAAPASSAVPVSAKARSAAAFPATGVRGLGYGFASLSMALLVQSPNSPPLGRGG